MARLSYLISIDGPLFRVLHPTEPADAADDWGGRDE